VQILVVGQGPQGYVVGFEATVGHLRRAGG
jgi:hypothetical protein